MHPLTLENKSEPGLRGERPEIQGRHKPRVLLSPRLIANPSYPEIREALDVQWGSFLTAAGLLPVLVPLRVDADGFFEDLDPVGLILTGGNDLASQGKGDLSLSRDDRERELLAVAEDRGLPVLGVCRGLQLLAEAGGFCLGPLPGHVAVSHILSVESESRLLGGFVGHEVNSYHGTGITGVSDDYRIAARAVDGSVEAIEHRSRHWIGIMWHPERYDPPRSMDVELVRKVFRGSRWNQV